MDLRCLLVLVSLLAFAPPFAQAVPIEDHIYFELATETHGDLYDKLNASLRLTNTPRYNPPDVEGKVILGVRRPNFHDEPLRWIMVHVSIGQETETTLAMAHDDLYILGFRDNNGNWYKLKASDANKKFQGLPGSRTLRISENYGDLLGATEKDDGLEAFSTVPLGKHSAIEAVKTLASYDLIMTDDDELRQALIRFVLMIPETMRFTVIRQEFSGWWEEESHITGVEASYLVRWRKFSSLLVAWKRTGKWGEGKRYIKFAAESVASVGIKDAGDALGIIDFVLRP